MFTLNPTANQKATRNLFTANGKGAEEAVAEDSDVAVFERFRRHLQAATKKWYDAKNAKHPSVEVYI